MRKHVLEYDDVMNKQRTNIYARRRELVAGQEDLGEKIMAMVEKEITEVVSFHFSQEQVDHKEIAQVMASIMPLQPQDIKDSNNSQDVIEHYFGLAEKLYRAKQERLGKDIMNQLERLVLLRSIDTLWQEHLDTMEHLRDSVRLRGYGQRDPLIEFKNEGFQLFQRLLAEIDKQIVYMIFKVDVVQQPQSRNTDHASRNIGRNDPCPCGSGKKWKKCGLLNTEEHKKLMAQKT